ncbi:hypothetical protein N665_0948s0017 [Sinapis alba]|nr:hypothetical protein N665_0948s0017 [Sinapis alba]
MVDDYIKEKETRGKFGNYSKVLQCSKSKGFGHVYVECENPQKRKKKIISKIDFDDGEDLKNIVAFTTLECGSKTKSAASSCGNDDDDGGGDDDDESFYFAVNNEHMYENWLKLVKSNSELNKEKVKLEAQVAKAFKYASKKMLNNGTKQLDHLLIIGKNNRFGLGFQGESSKAEDLFVSAEKFEVVAMFATRPELKVYAGNATKSTMTTATSTTSGKVSDLKTTSQRKFRHVFHHCGVVGHIRPMCFKLSREKNQMEQVYSMRCHGSICYSSGGFGLMNTWSRIFDHYGDGEMRFHPHFEVYGSSY